MRVVVTSDTHSPAYKSLPLSLQEEISKADAVIHAGDLGSPEFYSELKAAIPKLYAVRGNNDSLALPYDLTLELEGLKICVTHGDASRGNRENYLLYYFADLDPNIIIFGHTHQPKWEVYSTQTLLNPGSPTRNRGVGYHSFIILTLAKGNFEVEFIKIPLK